MKALPMPAALTTPEAFISHWQKAEANERAKLPARRSLPVKQPWSKSLTEQRVVHPHQFDHGCRVWLPKACASS